MQYECNAKTLIGGDHCWVDGDCLHILSRFFDRKTAQKTMSAPFPVSVVKIQHDIVSGAFFCREAELQEIAGGGKLPIMPDTDQVVGFHEEGVFVITDIAGGALDKTDTGSDFP